MFHAGREPHTVDHVTPSGVQARLESETIWLGWETPYGGGTLAYHRPVRVVSRGVEVAIRDHTAIVRALALALALTLPLIRRLR